MPLETIKKRSDFLTAASKGKRLSTGTFILQMLPRTEMPPKEALLNSLPIEAPRFGFTVTKKMGNAVVRNRIKRRLREAVRKTAPGRALPGHDYVVVSLHKILNCPFDVIVRDMEFAFSRIPVIKDNQTKYRQPNQSTVKPVQ